MRVSSFILHKAEHRKHGEIDRIAMWAVGLSYSWPTSPISLKQISKINICTCIEKEMAFLHKLHVSQLMDFVLVDLRPVRHIPQNEAQARDYWSGS
jgi:hypothetical protein